MVILEIIFLCNSLKHCQERVEDRTASTTEIREGGVGPQARREGGVTDQDLTVVRGGAGAGPIAVSAAEGVLPLVVGGTRGHDAIAIAASGRPNPSYLK